jgi:hypothetical protein
MTQAKSKQLKTKSKTSVKIAQEKIVALNFRVPFDFKKNFKIAAATHSITQSDLLQQAFEEWSKSHRKK